MRLCPSDASDGPPFRPHALDDSWRCLHRELVDKAGNPNDIGGGLGHRWILRGPVRESRRGRGALRNGGRSHGALPRWFNGPNFDQQSLAAGDAGETAQARTHWPWARARSQEPHSSQNRHGGVLSTGPRPWMQGNSEAVPADFTSVITPRPAEAVPAELGP